MSYLCIHEVHLGHVGLYPTFVFIKFISGMLLHVLPLHSWSTIRALWLIPYISIHKEYHRHVTSCPTISSMKYISGTLHHVLPLHPWSISQAIISCPTFAFMKYILGTLSNVLPLHPWSISRARCLTSSGKSLLSSRGGWVIKANTCIL